MEKGRRDTVLLTVIAIATLLVAIVGATFAYFTAQISGTNRGSTVTIRSSAGGSMTFYSTNVTLENIYPQGNGNTEAWATKPFRIDYTNANAQYDVKYKLTLYYANEFDSGELTYTLERTNNYCENDMSKITEDTCTGTWGTADNTGAVAATTISGTFDQTANIATTVRATNVNGIEATFANNNGSSKTQTHAYILKIYYPNKATNQNAAGQGKKFNAYVNATESSND